jgi:spore germination protein (amino acid permease)
VDKSWQVVFIYLLTHLGLIFFLYPANIIGSTDEAHWIPILTGVLFHILVVYMYLKGLSFFPGKDIIEIYTKAGMIVKISFLLPIFAYFIMAIIISIRAYSEIITIVFLSNTPLWAIMLLLLVITCYMAIKGIETIFRTGVMVAFLFLPLIIFVMIFSFQNVDWNYIYPAWNSDLSFLTKQDFLNSFFAIGGGYLFLGFVQPYFSYKKKKVFLGIALVVPCFFLSVYVPILTYGQATASTFFFPFVMTLDAINITWLIFDRVTIFFLLSLITFIMLFLSLVMWKAVRITNAFFPVVKASYLVIFFTSSIFLICLFIPNWSDVQRLFTWNTFLRFYVLITVPLSLLFIGKLSKGGNEHDA